MRADRHQMRRNAFIAAADKHAAVKRRGIGMDFDHIGNHIAAGQRIIHAVVPLRHPVADIGGEISGRLCVRGVYGLAPLP